MTATTVEDTKREDDGIRDAAEQLRRLIERAPAGEPLPAGRWEGTLKPLLRSSFRRWGARETDHADCLRREAARRTALLPLARDPRTPPDVLTRVLERLKDSLRYGLSYRAPEGRLIRAIAANPNTPPEALAECAAVCPKEFCRNPAVPLLVLEDSSFAGMLSADGAGRVLRRADAPGPLLASFAAGRWGAGRPDAPDRAEEARLRVGLAGEVADPAGWDIEARAYWRRYAAALPEWTEREAVCDLAAVGFAGTGWLTGVVRGARSAVDDVARALEPGLDAATLLGMADSARRGDRVAVRAAVALNPSVPEALRGDLPRHLAGHELRADTPEEARTVLRDAVVRWWTGKRGRGPMPLMTLLLLLAAPPTSPTRRLHEGVVSPDWRLRLVAALTLSAARSGGRNLLAALTGDGNRLVRAAARARLASPQEEFRL